MSRYWMDQYNPGSGFHPGYMATPGFIPGLDLIPPELQYYARMFTGKGVGYLFGQQASDYFMPGMFTGGAGDVIMERLLQMQQGQQASAFHQNLVSVNPPVVAQLQKISEAAVRLMDDGAINKEQLQTLDTVMSFIGNIATSRDGTNVLRRLVPGGTIYGNMLESVLPTLYAEPTINAIMRDYASVDRRSFFDSIFEISKDSRRGYGATPSALAELSGILGTQGVLGTTVYGQQPAVDNMARTVERYAGVLAEARATFGSDLSASRALRATEFFTGNITGMSEQEVEQRLAGLRQLMRATGKTAEELAAFVQEAQVIAQRAGMDPMAANALARTTVGMSARMRSGGIQAIDSIMGVGTASAFFLDSEDLARKSVGLAASLNKDLLGGAQFAMQQLSGLSDSELEARGDPVAMQILRMRRGEAIDLDVFNLRNISSTFGMTASQALGAVRDVFVQRNASNNADLLTAAVQSAGDEAVSMVMRTINDPVLLRKLRGMSREDREKLLFGDITSGGSGFDTDTVRRALAVRGTSSYRQLSENYYTSLAQRAVLDDVSVEQGLAAADIDQRRMHGVRGPMQVLDAFLQFATTGGVSDMADVLGIASKKELASALSGGLFESLLPSMSPEARKKLEKALGAIFPNIDLDKELLPQLDSYINKLIDTSVDPSRPIRDESVPTGVNNVIADISGSAITVQLIDVKGNEIVQGVVDIVANDKAGVRT